MKSKGFRRVRTATKKTPKNKSSVAPVIIIFLVCAAVLFVFAVFLGKYLEKLSEEPEDTYVPITADTDTSGKYRSATVPVIIGAAYDPDGGVLYPELPAPGSSSIGSCNAISVVLRTPLAEETDSSAIEEGSSATAVRSGTGMRLCYTSTLAAARSFDVCDDVNLNDFLAGAREKAAYVSGIFAVMFQTEPVNSRSILREYELSLLSELFESGINDIVLTGFSSDELGEAIAFIRDLKLRCSVPSTVGIAMDFDFYNNPGVRSIISASGFDCGFLALDLSGLTVPGLMTPPELTADRVARVASVVSLYSVRVIVGCGAPDGFADEINAAFKAGALNIQASLNK